MLWCWRIVQQEIQQIKYKILNPVVQGPPSNVFLLSTSAYFVNGNTQLMSDLTDNQFYPSAERTWLCICFNKWACGRLTEDADFSKKKNILFSDEAHYDLGGYVNKQNCNIWGTENPHVYIEKPKHPKRILVRILVQRHNWAIFLRKMSKQRPLQSMVIVIGLC